MNKSYSLYLDLVRFLAAMVVFLSHIASQDLTDGFLWQFKNYAQTAVIVFFVLSGYVIAYVCDTKERDGRSYAIARLARLYSVVLPALVITAVCDAIGLHFDPSLYHEASWPYPEGNQFSEYLLSLLLIHNIWDLQLNPGINGPFWSLTFEMFYYLGFGIVFFMHRPMKWLLLVFVILLGGPNILMLAPLWISGYLLFKHDQKRPNLKKANYSLATLSIAAIALMYFLGPNLREIDVSFSIMTRGEILGDYFDGLMIVLHLLWGRHLALAFEPFLYKYQQLFRWLGSLTFALYLFHRPIIQVIATVYDGDQSNFSYRISLIVITLLIVATIGRWCERQKTPLKKSLDQSLCPQKGKAAKAPLKRNKAA